MYHAIVRRNVRNGFAQLSQGNPKPVLSLFAPNILLTFAGNHALGAEVRGLEKARQWFERMLRIFPDLHIKPTSIWVSGWPWNTLVVTHFEVSAQLPGRAYSNAGIQLLRLSWGKILEDRLIEDTVLLQEALNYLAARGVDEAKARPLR